MRVHDPKPRIITRAPFADRVVHTALVDVIEPVFARSLMPEDFACRPGFGTHRAVLALRGAMRRHRFAVHLDVRAFFPSVEFDVLRRLITARVDDPALMAVLDLVFECGRTVYADPEVRRFARLTDDWPPPGRGLHVYLMGLDHHIKRVLKVPSYVRYGDDICCFGDRRADLRAWRAAIGQWLWEERGLRLKHPEARILSCAGHLDALGHRVRRAGVAPLGRARRRLVARVAAALDGRAGVDVERSIAATAGVLLF